MKMTGGGGGDLTLYVKEEEFSIGFCMVHERAPSKLPPAPKLSNAPSLGFGNVLAPKHPKTQTPWFANDPLEMNAARAASAAALVIWLPFQQQTHTKTHEERERERGTKQKQRERERERNKKR